MTDTTLLPCPFCGNDGSGPIEDALQVAHLEADWRDTKDTWTVQCDKCTATMGYSDSEEEAIAAWNRRDQWLPFNGGEDHAGEHWLAWETNGEFQYMIGDPRYTFLNKSLADFICPITPPAPVSGGK